MKKVCKGCGRILDLDRFYKHSQMKDGFLNFCIDCVKERVRQHREENIESIRAYDRLRGKTPEKLEKQKMYRQRLKDTDYDRYKEVFGGCQARYTENHPEARKAHSKVSNAIHSGKLSRPNKCERCGVQCKPEAHHPDYSQPFLVEWLCVSCHAKTRVQSLTS